jgi:hypothetical protein
MRSDIVLLLLLLLAALLLLLLLLLLLSLPACAPVGVSPLHMLRCSAASAT